MVLTLNPNVWESHTFNPRIREVETGAIWLVEERNIKWKRQKLNRVWTLSISRDRILPFKFEDLVEKGKRSL